MVAADNNDLDLQMADGIIGDRHHIEVHVGNQIPNVPVEDLRLGDPWSRGWTRLFEILRDSVPFPFLVVSYLR